MPARKLKPEEWAEHYQIELSTVWRMIRDGRIRAINLGSPRRPIYRIPESELARYDRDHAAA